MEKPNTPTVFISYSWADELTALAMDQWLRDQGARVFIDRRDFIPGYDIEAEIVRCIKNTGKVVCIYSVNSANRPYPELERRIATSLEREIGARRRLIYFCIDDTELPVEAKPRLAIKAADLEFEAACQELWRSILEEGAPPTQFNLSSFKEKAPWKMTKDDEKDILVENVKALTKVTEDFIETRPGDVSRIAELFKDFKFLPTRRYLERVLSVVQQKIKSVEPSQRGLKAQLDELSVRMEKEKEVFGFFFTLALLEARERDMLNLCRRAAELIQSGLTDAEEEELEDIKSRINEMFGVE